jgi:DNA-binding transcriptional ArsR family regulator
MQSSNEVFRALADPTRRAILDLLRKGAHPANDIAGAFPVSRPAVSKHLRLLREADLVIGRKKGRQQFYELNATPLSAVEDWLSQYRQMWKGNLMRLKKFAEEDEKRKRKR